MSTLPEANKAKPAAIIAALRKMPKRKRNQTNPDFAEILMEARQARARGASWVPIILEIRKLGFDLSIVQIRHLVEPNAVIGMGPYPEAANDSCRISANPW